MPKQPFCLFIAQYNLFILVTEVTLQMTVLFV